MRRGRRGLPSHRGIYSVNVDHLGSRSPSLAPVYPVPLLWRKHSCCDKEPYLFREKEIFLSDFYFLGTSSWPKRVTGPRGGQGSFGGYIEHLKCPVGICDVRPIPVTPSGNTVSGAPPRCL